MSNLKNGESAPKKTAKKTITKENLNKENKKVFDFKKFNLETVAPKKNNGANVKVGKYIYHENEKVESSTRQKFRKVLDRNIDNILFSANELKKENNNTNNALFLDAIKVFNTDYQHRYLDSKSYTVESLLNSNATPNFLTRVKIALDIIKEFNLQGVI